MAYDFKSEEEVELYLKNLGTEYKFSCFKEKNAEGCHLLGEYLEGIQRDFEGAANVYKKNCDDRNFPLSCFKFGSYSYLGKGCKADFRTAFDYKKKSCDLNYYEGCLHCGVMLTNNDKNNHSLEKDYVEGLKHLEKSCMGGNSTACYFASSIYITGAEGVERNRTKASELSKRACEGGNRYACANLSQMYSKGDGVEKNEKMAVLYRERAREIKNDLKKGPAIDFQQFT